MRRPLLKRTQVSGWDAKYTARPLSRSDSLPSRLSRRAGLGPSYELISGIFKSLVKTTSSSDHNPCKVPSEIEKGRQLRRGQCSNF